VSASAQTQSPRHHVKPCFAMAIGNLTDRWPEIPMSFTIKSRTGAQSPASERIVTNLARVLQTKLQTTRETNPPEQRRHATHRCSLGGTSECSAGQRGISNRPTRGENKAVRYETKLSSTIDLALLNRHIWGSAIGVDAAQSAGADHTYRPGSSSRDINSACGYPHRSAEFS
jgi:hypothetical protein